MEMIYGERIVKQEKSLEPLVPKASHVGSLFSVLDFSYHWRASRIEPKLWEQAVVEDQNQISV